MSAVKQVGRQFVVFSDAGFVVGRYSSIERAERRRVEFDSSVASDAAEAAIEQKYADFKAGGQSSQHGPPGAPCCDVDNTSNENRADESQMTPERREMLLSQTQLGRSASKAMKDKARDVNAGRDKGGRAAKKGEDRSPESKKPTKTDAGSPTQTVTKDGEKTRREV